MYDFTYHRPQTLDAAARLIAGGGALKLLAGGMSLIPSLKLRFAQYDGLVDLGALNELKGIRREGDALSIGAMTPHGEVAASEAVARSIPALSALAEGIGDPLVRNRGTMGGSIANADPAADYPSAIVGLGATVATNQREIPGDEFFRGLFETALQPGEIITRVRYPVPERAAYAKLVQPASRFALVGVFVAKLAGGVRVAVTGAGPSVFRVPEMEKALAKNFSETALDNLKIDPAGLSSDLHGSADYRAHCVTVMARRAVKAALAK